MMKCPKCQTENRDAARFCGACGARLVTGAVVAQPSEEGLIPSPAEEAAAAESATKAGLPSAIASRSGEPANEVAARIREAAPLPPHAGPDPAPVVSLQQDTQAPAETSAHVGALAPTEESATTVSDPQAQLIAAPAAEVGEPISVTEPQASQTPAPASPPAESLQPLSPGGRVAGRFEIVELLETTPEANLYLARDLGKCPSCGAVNNTPSEQFCAQCGVDLKSVAAAATCQLREARSPDALGVPAEETLTDGDRVYFPAPDQPTAASEPATARPAARPDQALTVGHASHVGMVRELDEDSLCVFTLTGVYESVNDPSLGLFMVADGIGGHDGGEVASKMTVQIVARELISRLLLPRFLDGSSAQGDAVPTLVSGAVADANKAVFEEARQRGNDMGCTLTLALVMDGTAHIANVGDSRTYIYRQGKLRQITTDHSLVASLVTAGALAPEEIFTHPDRSVIYRSVGANETVEVDTFEEPLAPGDILLLCCDGLWEMIRDEGIEDVLLAYLEPQAACTEMVRRANLAGGDDNISVIVVNVRKGG
jgi:serine/threonine protein phosphatase PrpC